MTDTIPFELDRETNSLILRRRVAATPERLFDAWTQPDQVTRWWDPSGRPLVACEIDLREGGGFRFVNAGGEQFPFEGRYTIIDRPTLLAFQAMGADGTVRFEAEGETTLMTVTMACASAEQLEQFARMGIAEGTARTLDNLVAFVGRDG